MSKHVVDKSRRDAVRMMVTGIAVAPFASIAAMSSVQAGALPAVTPDDPNAQALQYVEDATKATRTDKMGVAAAKQDCASCQFVQADSGARRPCQLFPGKSVSEKGWCAGWAPKA